MPPMTSILSLRISSITEAQELDVDTLSHESGPAQLEINFNHGDP
jgi:glutamine synthetase